MLPDVRLASPTSVPDELPIRHGAASPALIASIICHESISYNMASNGRTTEANELERMWKKAVDACLKARTQGLVTISKSY
jgi:hypothetical protein